MERYAVTYFLAYTSESSNKTWKKESNKLQMYSRTMLSVPTLLYVIKTNSEQRSWKRKNKERVEFYKYIAREVLLHKEKITCTSPATLSDSTLEEAARGRHCPTVFVWSLVLCLDRLCVYWFQFIDQIYYFIRAWWRVMLLKASVSVKHLSYYITGPRHTTVPPWDYWPIHHYRIGT